MDGDIIAADIYANVVRFDVEKTRQARVVLNDLTDTFSVTLGVGIDGASELQRVDWIDCHTSLQCRMGSIDFVFVMLREYETSPWTP